MPRLRGTIRTIDPTDRGTRLTVSHADQPAAVLSREHLIANKRASGRMQDLADIERLEGVGRTGA